MNHTIVYSEAGRFAGWPANYGIWSWGEEVVVGFGLGWHNPAAPAHSHTRDRSRPMLPMQARSQDGGSTWSVEPMPAPSPGGAGFSADEHMTPEIQVATAIRQGRQPLPAPCPGDIDFTHPDFAWMCARTGLGKGTVAWFYLSTDRCRSWQGPYRLPSFGLAGIEARTDVLVTGPREALVFLTASKRTGGEGSGVICAHTRDGGQSFERKAWVARSRGEGFKIMPATVRLDGEELRCAVRCQTEKTGRIEVYASPDLGQSWRLLSCPVQFKTRISNPPTLTCLPGGRLALVYGYRAQPYGIRARISSDGGATWGGGIGVPAEEDFRAEIRLREDGASPDLGYPRTILLPGGDLLTVYYFNTSPLGERHIAATRWTP